MLLVYKIKYYIQLKKIESQKSKFKELSNDSIVVNLHLIKNQVNNKNKKILVFSLLLSLIEKLENIHISEKETITLLASFDNMAINISKEENEKVIKAIVSLAGYYFNKNVIYVGLNILLEKLIQKINLDHEDIKSITFNDFLKKSYLSYKKLEKKSNEFVVFDDMDEFIQKSSSPYKITKNDFLRKFEKEKIKEYFDILLYYYNNKELKEKNIIYEEIISKNKKYEYEFFLEIEPYLEKFNFNNTLNYPDTIEKAISYKNKEQIITTKRLVDSISLTNLISIYGEFFFIGNGIEDFSYESYFLYKKQLLNLESKKITNLKFLELQNQRDQQINYDLILNHARFSYYKMKEELKTTTHIENYVLGILKNNKTLFFSKNKMQYVSYLLKEFSIVEIINKSYDIEMPEIYLKKYKSEIIENENLIEFLKNFEFYLVSKYQREITYSQFVLDKMWANFLNLFEYAKRDAFLSQYSRKKEFDVLTHLTIRNFEIVFIKNFLKFFQ